MSHLDCSGINGKMQSGSGVQRKERNESVLALLVDRNRSILTLPGRRALPVLLMRRNLSPEVVLDEYNSSTSRTQRKMALLLLLKLQKLWPK
ncbi:hypothetical protein HRI_001694800 [Hibiscus trionum]|uniref:Uncharacterized protein n=1 Tax=Hibiscus trionum TaxID=183268 RepID=A0A9W7LZ52_HIBTR|nr:hypothetical protein HRI_001694800 [Hibiscus trionum]